MFIPREPAHATRGGLLLGQTYQSIVINAPPAKVWTAIRDFHDLVWAPNVITKVEAVGDGSSTFVEWTSQWEKNDEAASEFCHGVYVALLDDMKKSLEA